MRKAEEFARQTGLSEQKYGLANWLVDNLGASRSTAVEVLKGSVSFDTVLSDYLKKRGESLRKTYVMFGGNTPV